MDQEFVECDACRKIPDCPVLCDGCLHNQAVIEGLVMQKVGICKQAFYEGWQAHQKKPLGNPIKELVESKVFLETKYPTRDDKATAAAAMKPWPVPEKPSQFETDLKEIIESITKALKTNVKKSIVEPNLERVLQESAWRLSMAQTLQCLCDVLCMVKGGKE